MCVAGAGPAFGPGTDCLQNLLYLAVNLSPKRLDTRYHLVSVPWDLQGLLGQAPLTPPRPPTAGSFPVRSGHIQGQGPSMGGSPVDLQKVSRGAGWFH